MGRERGAGREKGWGAKTREGREWGARREKGENGAHDRGARQEKGANGAQDERRARMGRKRRGRRT